MDYWPSNKYFDILKERLTAMGLLCCQKFPFLYTTKKLDLKVGIFDSISYLLVVRTLSLAPSQRDIHCCSTMNKK